MKKLLVLSLLAIFMLVGFSSCKKYEDGPMISFRSKTSRLVGDWKITKVTESGIDVSDKYDTYAFTFKDDNTYTHMKTKEETGKWSFNDDKTKIELTINGTGTIDSYTIIRLKNDELTLEQTVGTHLLKFYYVAK